MSNGHPTGLEEFLTPMALNHLLLLHAGPLKRMLQDSAAENLRLVRGAKDPAQPAPDSRDPTRQLASVHRSKLFCFLRASQGLMEGILSSRGKGPGVTCGTLCKPSPCAWFHRAKLNLAVHLPVI